MFNDALQKAMAQARDIQKHITAAAADATEQMKPHVQQSLESARAMQATLAEHAAAQSALAAKAADSAAFGLGAYIKMGSEAMRESVELTRETTLKMVDQSKKIVDAAGEALAKSDRREQ